MNLSQEAAQALNAFESDDLDWAAAKSPGASRKVVEMAFHKARMACPHVSEPKRRESQKWLANRNVCDIMGEMVTEGGELP